MTTPACDASGPIVPFLVAVAPFVASFLVLLRIRESQHLES